MRLRAPKAQDFLGAVRAHAEGDVDRPVAHQALVTDLDPQRVEIASNGRACQAATSSSTAPVTALIRSGETSIP